MRIAIAAVVAIVLLGALVAGVAFAAPRVLEQLYPVPEQPLTFPHNIHAGIAQLDCQFCHRNVDKGAAATVPALEQCMFCHAVIPGAAGAEKMRTAFNNGEPITWTRVHRVPDHVNFWHEPHIRVLSSRMSTEQGRDVLPAEVCSTCHGEVKSVQQVEQIRPLNMSDCVDCHRANNAPTDCAVCHF